MRRWLASAALIGSSALVASAQDSQAPAAEIRFFRPNYVIAGFDRANQVKFQFSVRYRFVEELPVYFAYTQRSFWDLYEWDRSTPFRESNYNPALFWEERPPEGSVLQAARFGVDHESNGKAGLTSRSWNRVFLEAAFVVIDRRLSILPRLNAPFAVAPENADILDFLGPGEVMIEYISATIPDHSRLQITIRKGRGWNGNRFSWSSDWLLRPQTVFGFKPFGLNPSLYIQLWRGYGESLIDYNHFLTRFRVGVRF
ncbi:MAG: phospholipase A [Bacteroidetes bacterium]|jgi:phospholipase A1|nr:phospholipase A [Bacteroidota bacterium]